MPCWSCVAGTLRPRLGGSAGAAAAAAAATMPLFVAVGSRSRRWLACWSGPCCCWPSSAAGRGRSALVARCGRCRWGLGLETKWTTVRAGPAWLSAWLRAQEGRHLRCPWPGLGLGAMALWLPNLVWQALNGWPTLPSTLATTTPKCKTRRGGRVPATQIVLTAPRGSAGGRGDVVLAAPAVAGPGRPGGHRRRAERSWARPRTWASPYLPVILRGWPWPITGLADGARRWHQAMRACSSPHPGAAGRISFARWSDLYLELFQTSTPSWARRWAGPRWSTSWPPSRACCPRGRPRVVTPATARPPLDLYGRPGPARGHRLVRPQQLRRLVARRRAGGHGHLRALHPAGPGALLRHDRARGRESATWTASTTRSTAHPSTCASLRVSPEELREALRHVG